MSAWKISGRGNTQFFLICQFCVSLLNDFTDKFHIPISALL